MNPNSQKDNFSFLFPSSFVPKDLEDKWKIHLKNFRKPFPTVLDYVNSNIKDITLPGLNIPTTVQKKIYAKERNFRSSKSPYDLSSREFNLTLRNTDFNIFYFLLKDIMYYHYIKNDKPFIDDFTVTILDNQRREHLKIYLKEVLFLNISDIKLANQEKEVEEQQVVLSFLYNFEDIEYIPKWSIGSPSGEILDEYSNILLKNDDSIINGAVTDIIANDGNLNQLSNNALSSSGNSSNNLCDLIENCSVIKDLNTITTELKNKVSNLSGTDTYLKIQIDNIISSLSNYVTHSYFNTVVENLASTSFVEYLISQIPTGNSTISGNATTSGNGLTLVNNNIYELGGSLNRDTVIDGTNFNFTINVDEFIVNSGTNSSIFKINSKDTFIINSKGIGINTDANNKFAYIKTDNLTNTRYYRLPDEDSLLASTSFVVNIINKKINEIIIFDYTTAGLSTIEYVDSEVVNINNDINNLYSSAGYLENRINNISIVYNDYTTAGLSTVSYVDTEVSNLQNDINLINTNISYLQSSSGKLEFDLFDLSSDVSILNIDYNLFKNSKGQANGLASLGADAKIPESQLPYSVLGATIYQGTWNALTNSPTLVSSSGTKGYYYIVSVAGSTNLNGISDWALGDWIIFNGTTWNKVDNTDAVVSVNGQTGIVNLTTSNISEGSNFYYTTSRFNTSFSGKTTTNLTEGSNLYYTTARFTTDFSGKTTTNLTEGTNLYYTQARFDTAFTAKSTTNLTEGTNLYYTQTRFNTAFSAKSTTDLAEGTNLYYTQTRFNTAFTAKTTDNLTQGSTNKYYATSLFNTDLATKSTTNLAEGSNLYYTTARFTTDFSGKSTTNLAEGTNLYYTQARFDTAFTAKSTTDLAEGSNLYYTNTRTDNRISVQKGVAFGLATLDSSSKIPTSQLPYSVLGATIYQGTWNALTNSPTLTSSVGTNGYYYIVSVSGSTLINGISDWAIGDWIIFNGSTWNKVDNTDAVVSVNGQTGIVNLTTSNISEGSNFYYTQTRFNTAFTAKSTTNLAEGTNLYYTNARTIASTLTGYASSSGTISSTDTILQAIQKLNGNAASLIGFKTEQQFYIEGATNKAYPILSKKVYAETLTKVWGIKTTSGTCTAAIQLNGTPVTFTGAVTTISVTSTPQNIAIISGGNMVAGDRVTIVITSASLPADLEGTIEMTRL